MAAEEPLISVMLPAHHAAGTLEAAARSCLEQTHRNLELILIENDSDPETLSIMERLSADDSRARVLRTPAGAGFIAALNFGWQEAKGDWLARMDADDFSHPERFEKQLALLRARPELSAVGSLVNIVRRGEDGKALPPLDGYGEFEVWLNSVTEPEEMAAQRFIDSPIANPCAMMRRDAMEALSGYREVCWAEDYDFWLRLIESGRQIAKVPEVLLTWYDSEPRLTRNDDHYSLRNFQRARAHFLARLPQVREQGVAIHGAGPIGKKLARDLIGEGIDVKALLDVSKRRVGNEVGGIPIHHSDETDRFRDAIMVGAVGRPGARQRIRGLVEPLGYVEGHDFFCAA